MIFNIQEFIDRDYVTDVRKNRRKVTQEFFTPYSIVKRMCDKDELCVFLFNTV